MMKIRNSPLFWITGLMLAVGATRGQNVNRPTLKMTQTHFQETYISPDTGCHQGYAWDGTNHYTITNTQLFKHATDSNWTIIVSNMNVFVNWPYLEHLGDGDYYNGKLYIAAEYWVNCTNFTHQSIVTYDSTTLQPLNLYDVSGDGHEVSGLCVVPTDGTNGIVYMTSYCDGSQVWKYDLLTMTLVGTIQTSQNLLYLQGLCSTGSGTFYLSEDGGQIYSMDGQGNVGLVYYSLLPGSHEGLKWVDGSIRILIDAGTGNKRIHYVTRDCLVFSYPCNTANCGVQSSPAISGPWTPIPGGLMTTNGNTVSLTTAANPSGGPNQQFYSLAQP